MDLILRDNYFLKVRFSRVIAPEAGPKDPARLHIYEAILVNIIPQSHTPYFIPRNDQRIISMEPPADGPRLSPGIPLKLPEVDSLVPYGISNFRFLHDLINPGLLKGLLCDLHMPLAKLFLR